jgi:four helix bundle protein
MRSFRNLEAWQKAAAFVKEIYRATHDFPADEQEGLAQEMRVSAITIPAKIANGFGRNSRAQLYRSAGLARKTLNNLDIQIEIAGDMGYLRSEISSGLLMLSNELGRELVLLQLRCKGDKRRR